ncbi:hypothetical protein SO802_020458 [Lithocarpus litseifolius]|uniref:carbamoyl-phosphate synthase (glutamine-hydrolyzing) n=1 Tax=Lithocarpus litseifolius TaxID=425828 RepID=A0AAW2CCF6_9ROSI
MQDLCLKMVQSGGLTFGASGTQVGEVAFNASLTGYQEILTDPSYAGQFGDTGVNFDDEESMQCFLGGLVIRSLSISTSNWRCTETLGDYLAERNIMGIYDVDTRAITHRLRQDGSLIGALSTEESKSDEELLELSRSWDIVKTLKIKPDGVLFSNGPGDPSAVPYAVETVKEILGKVHVFGICMGHQLLGQALGVDSASLPEGVEVTHVNLNDGSCAGLAYPAQNIMSLQYHPEASPGPHDSDNAFQEFIELMKRAKENA